MNVHPSYLPAYRGADPIPWEILHKESELGVTIHIIDQGIDTGAIVCQDNIPLPRIPLFALAENRLAKLIPNMLLATIHEIDNDRLSTKPQSGGFYLPVPTLKNRAKNRKNKF